MKESLTEHYRKFCEKAPNNQLLRVYIGKTMGKDRFSTDDMENFDIECMLYSEILTRMEDGTKMRDLFKERGGN